MLMGSTSMGLMNMVAKVIKATTPLTSLHVSIWRGIGLVIFSYNYCKYIGTDPLKIPRHVSLSFFLRCFFGWLSTTGMFIAIFLMPFSLAMVLNFT